jgi:hypothetical protein
MNIPLLLVKYPNLFYHQDLTKADRKLDLHVVLLILCLIVLFNRENLCLVKDHHVDKIFDFELQLLVEDNRITQSNISKHLNFHIL